MLVTSIFSLFSTMISKGVVPQDLKTPVVWQRVSWIGLDSLGVCGSLLAWNGWWFSLLYFMPGCFLEQEPQVACPHTHVQETKDLGKIKESGNDFHFSLNI